MITLRPFRTADDLTPVLALDTSFTTHRVFQLRQNARAFALDDILASPPLHKEYPLAEEVTALSSSDWVRVADDSGTVVGFASMQLEAWNRRAALRHLYVARAARGHGVGRALVEAAVHEAGRLGARCVWAETQTVNYGAVQFYERLGFVWCGLDTSLYDPGGAAGSEVAVFFSRAVE